MSARKGWRGYVFSRPINGQTIPQRVQNLVLRTYAEKNRLRFLLSATEYHMPGSFMMLESQYPSLRSLEGLLFYSVSMLPEKRDQRLRLYDAVLKAGGGIRFALEELALLDLAGVQLIEDVLATRALSGRADVSVLEGK
jgi:sporadic carbohydrate cluster protein (TIGR04323 family)